MNQGETSGAALNRAEELLRQMRDGAWPEQPGSALELLQSAVEEAERRREGAIDVDIVKRAVRMLREAGHG